MTEEVRLALSPDLARRFRDATPEQLEQIRRAIASILISEEERIEAIRLGLERQIAALPPGSQERRALERDLEDVLSPNV